MDQMFIKDTVQKALALDALESSHPISVPVDNTNQIRQIFDEISYSKGACIVRMMSLFLGETTFKVGITNYLQAHKWGNAHQQNLWVSLTQRAHEDHTLPTHVSVREIMETWTLQTGYPVVRVVRGFIPGTAVVTQVSSADRLLRGHSEKVLVCLQERFYLLKEDGAGRRSKSKWWVPLTYTSQESPNFNSTIPVLWMENEESVVIDGLPDEKHWLLLNNQLAGFYRVNYDMFNWRLITQNIGTFPTVTRAQLFDDSLNLARAGLLDYSVPMNLAKTLGDEHEYLPWASALQGFGYLFLMLSSSRLYKDFKVGLYSDTIQGLQGGPLFRYNTGTSRWASVQIQYRDFKVGLCSDAIQGPQGWASVQMQYRDLKGFVLSLLERPFETLGFEEKTSDSQIDIVHRIQILENACNLDHPECVSSAVAKYRWWMNRPSNNPAVPKKLRPPHPEGWDDPDQSGYLGRRELTPPHFQSLTGWTNTGGSCLPPIQGGDRSCLLPLTEATLRPWVWEWGYAHCAWESNSPLLVNMSGDAHVLAHVLLTVRVSTGGLNQLTAQMAKPRTSPRCQRHHSSVIKLTASQSPTHFWAASRQARDVVFRPSPVISANQKQVVYCTAIKHGGLREWEFAWRQYSSTNVGSEQETLLAALGCSRNLWILNRYLKMMMDESSGIRKQDGALVFTSVANTEKGNQIAFYFLRNNWKELLR
uniref:Uncharacterized protein n=1 Tax=Timema tahoe TaxID=61484 RepID=A0A7R9FJ42_9NEOP|nr:unnamed protein product [Timema tahoe]